MMIGGVARGQGISRSGLCRLNSFSTHLKNARIDIQTFCMLAGFNPSSRKLEKILSKSCFFISMIDSTAKRLTHLILCAKVG